MKVLSTEALTKLIQLIKSAFIKVDDVVEVTEISLATVATSGDYDDLSNKPTVDQTYDGTSTNAQSGVAVASAISSKANTDLSNLTSQGQNIANWSSNVTNCITEIPQDIKLELNNGTLTLKAGSVLTDPQGGTQRTTTQDQTLTFTTKGQYMIFVDRRTGAIQLSSEYTVARIGSGSTLPADGSTFRVFYNSTDGKIYRWNGSTWDVWGVAFPLGIITVSDGAISSIDQVFNGFGYIGSTIFALPGVKGLIPNGRNEGGSLKNIEFTLDSVKIVNNPDTNNALQYLCWSSNNYFTRANQYHEQKERPSWANNNNNIWYNPETNKTYYYRNSDNQSFIPFIFTGLTFRGTSGSTTISEFNQSKTPFHALDYNDSSTISGWAMPSSRYIDLTLGACGSTYTAPANGWVFLRKRLSSSGQVLEIRNNRAFLSSRVFCYAPNDLLGVYLPVKKSDIFYVEYAGTNTDSQMFRFVYAEGEN